MTIADDAVPEVADPAGYPVEWEFDGLLRNGEAVVVRPIRPADAPALIGCAGPVSPGTHQHVLLDGPALSRQAAAQFSEVDYDARMAFVALVSDEMVGLASYDRPDARAPAAEASFIVAGHRRGHGVTTLLFESLAEYARTRGILCFTAEVRAQNTAMLELFAATGLRCTRRDGPATVRVEIDLRPTAAYRSSCDQREAMAEEGGGLTVPELPQPAQRALGEVLVPAAATANPVDLTADGTAAMLEQALDTVLGDDAIDAVITIVVETMAISAAEVRETITRVAQRAGKPVVACSVEAGAPLVPSGAAQVAEIPSPERTAAAPAHVCAYAQWRRRPLLPADEPEERSDQPAISQIIAAKLAASPGGGWLELDQAAGLLAACGLPVLPTRGAATAAQAVAAAEAVGFPVALKARSGDVVHKSEVGGVALGLADSEAVRAAYETMQARLGAQMGGAVIQPMASPGVEAIVGLAADPEFGPVVMVGLGGVMTDLLQDRAFAVPPLEPGAAEAMVASLRAAPLLDGYRGAPKADRQALVAVLEQVARVAEEVPELVELDLNPGLVSSAGALAIGSELCSGSATCARNARPLGPAPAKTRGSGLPASRG